MEAPRGVDGRLWQRLEAHARRMAAGREPAHDFLHVERVVRNAVCIARAEVIDEPVPAIAALLHELYALPKSHPDSSKAGDVCAEHARELLLREGAPTAIIAPVCSAIRDHAFSKGVVVEAKESQVLQDADRLDAIGAIGVARLWATCAEMKRPFYSSNDPFCRSRAPNDKAFGLDHVFSKLLVVQERLHFPSSRALAVERARFLKTFIEQLVAELSV